MARLNAPTGHPASTTTPTASIKRFASRICSSPIGENGAANEAIRDNYPGLVALMIVCMNVVTLPFAFLGFVSGKKKHESDRASMHGGK